MEKIREIWSKLLVWLKAHMTIVYIVVGGAIALFVLWKFVFKRKRTYRRRRRVLPRSVGMYKVRTSNRGKGSDYMRRKMARLRSLRRRKR